MGWNPWWLVERIHPSHHPKDPWKLWRGPWWSPPRQFRNRHRQWLGHVTPRLWQCSEIMVHGRSRNSDIRSYLQVLPSNPEGRRDERWSQKGLFWLIQVLVDWLICRGLRSTCHRRGARVRLLMEKGFLVFPFQKVVSRVRRRRNQDLALKLGQVCWKRWDANLLMPRPLNLTKNVIRLFLIWQSMRDEHIWFTKLSI